MFSGMLSSMFSGIKSLWQTTHRAAWLTSVAAAVVALVGVATAVQRVADHQMAAVTDRAASNWARQLATTVPDLDLLLLGERPSAQAQDVLTSLRGMSGLVRFKLYDPQGALQLVSDSVATAPQPQDSDRTQGLQPQLHPRAARHRDHRRGRVLERPERHRCRLRDLGPPCCTGHCSGHSARHRRRGPLSAATRGP